MNRIEERLSLLQDKQEKAFITYLTAGLPNLNKTKTIIKALEEAGTDIVEVGIPFSDPVADGPVIQAASYEAICNGVTLSKIFVTIKELRNEGLKLPVVFMLYYNTILHYGVESFVNACKEAQVDGLIIPDLPMEEQQELKNCLVQEEAPILIQLVSPVSKDRIPQILNRARGFVYCVSSMGVTGQTGGFHKEVLSYLSYVKEVSPIPVMIGFGVKEAKDILPMKEIIDGAIVGTHFIQLLRESNFNEETASNYAKTFKEDLKSR